MLLIVVAMAGSVAALRWRRGGFVVTILPLIALYLASTPWLADAANAGLASLPANDGAVPEIGAIVVLGGDIELVADGRNQVRLGPISLRRVFLAAAAYRRTGLPILVSGGTIADTGPSIAELMSAAFQRDFAIPVRWRETRSQNTYQNAEFSVPMLKAAGVRTILLATQPRDFPRAAWSFHRFGMAVEPAAPSASILATGNLSDFLPSPKALLGTFYAVHELLGLIYYRWAYG
jgi:uncharacterized SAM-binding protein YcdF (DUF218 family)